MSIKNTKINFRIKTNVDPGHNIIRIKKTKFKYSTPTLTTLFINVDRPKNTITTLTVSMRRHMMRNKLSYLINILERFSRKEKAF